MWIESLVWIQHATNAVVHALLDRLESSRTQARPPSDQAWLLPEISGWGSGCLPTFLSPPCTPEDALLEVCDRQHGHDRRVTDEDIKNRVKDLVGLYAVPCDQKKTD